MDQPENELKEYLEGVAANVSNVFNRRPILALLIVFAWVLVCVWLDSKKLNIQTIYSSLNDLTDQSELYEYVEVLDYQVESFDLLLFHSINMIVALLEKDMIVFYKIYESFDKLGIFNSNWENDVASRLESIDDKMTDLIESIYEMENKIVNEILKLQYIHHESYSNLSESITKQLSNVNSSIQFGNLIGIVQSYQLHKMNNNLKQLR